MDDAVWVPTVFSKNRERLIEHDAVIALFDEVMEIAPMDALAVGRAFQRGWDVDPGLGRAQELQAQGRR